MTSIQEIFKSINEINKEVVELNKNKEHMRHIVEELDGSLMSLGKLLYDLGKKLEATPEGQEKKKQEKKKQEKKKQEKKKQEMLEATLEVEEELKLEEELKKDTLRYFIRQQIVANLTGHISKKDNTQYIKSLEPEIAATIEAVIKTAEEDEDDERKENESLEEYIRSWEGDWFREIMAEHIEYLVENEEDDCGCGLHPTCCGYNPHDTHFGMGS